MTFQHEEFDNHERVIFVSDAATDLRGIIAIHNTNRGPALGGCRMWEYDDDRAALTDVLRLSRGMSYKAALADLELGGGKSVIIGNPKSKKSPELLRAFARAVGDLNGKYYTAEDVGIGLDDISVMRDETNCVVGVPHDQGGSGDPSPTTAWGVFLGIRCSAQRALGAKDLNGVRVAVQGLGNVGGHLAQYLYDAGAKLILADIDEKRLGGFARKFDAEVEHPDRIHASSADIFAPCALGAVINDVTLKELKVKVVSGAANNPLHTEAHGRQLFENGVLYAPDYVVNSGGLIRVASERTGFDAKWVDEKVAGIETTLSEIFDLSDAEGIPTNQAADRVAQSRINTSQKQT
ncbi:amino acid dehydrogenase [Litoreibacter sp.]|nr:amino acid dehydrogenase [Litoreibacter sp.]